MKTLPAAMTTHITGDGPYRLAFLLKIVLQDATEIRVTTHGEDLTYNSQTYTAADGYNATTVHDKAGAQVDTMQADTVVDTLALSSAFSRLVDGATFDSWIVDYNDPDGTAVKMRSGTLGAVTMTDIGREIELRGLAQRLQQPIGEVYSPTDRAELGDARNGLSAATYTTSSTVTAVTDRRVFDTGLGQADDYYNYGLLTWTSGNNSGLAMEVKTYTNANGNIELFQAMPGDVQIGDGFDVVAGYDKTLDQALNTFNNVVNFRGEPFIPVQEILAQVGHQVGAIKDPSGTKAGL